MNLDLELEMFIAYTAAIFGCGMILGSLLS